MHGQSPASPEGGRYLSRVGGGVVALGQTGERHPWISFFCLARLAPTIHTAPWNGGRTGGCRPAPALLLFILFMQLARLTLVPP